MSGKGKRKATAKRQEAQARGRTRREQRKAKIKQLDKLRHATNNALRQAGEPTPWERAKIARAERRARERAA